MSSLATSFVLGYHGCDSVFAQSAIAGGSDLRFSEKAYDWLGSGAYFWEADPRRAAEWAQWKVQRGDYIQGSVVGAVINLGYCLDLTTRVGISAMQVGFESFRDYRSGAGLTMPENKSAPGQPDEDRLLRYLDRAVIEHLHEMLALDGARPYDSVRGMFTEGPEAFPGAGFRERTHTQIAVRNPACILGLFRPRGEAAAAIAAVLG